MLKSQTFRPLTTFYIAKKQHCKHVIYNVVKKYKLAANFANPLSGDVLLNASRKGGLYIRCQLTLHQIIVLSHSFPARKYCNHAAGNDKYCEQSCRSCCISCLYRTVSAACISAACIAAAGIAVR